MKRAPAFALVSSLALAGVAYPGAHYPDVCLVTGEAGSVLCAGLIEHFELNEASDNPRFGAGTLKCSTDGLIGPRGGLET
jgi:hypothetical protein